MQKLFVNSSWECEMMRASSCHDITWNCQVWRCDSEVTSVAPLIFLSSSVSRLSYCPNSGLLVNHSMTHAFLCVFLLWGWIAFFFLFFCLIQPFCYFSSMARAAAKNRHLLFVAIILLSLWHSASRFFHSQSQNDQGISDLLFKWHAQVGTNSVQIAQTSHANAGSV